MELTRLWAAECEHMCCRPPPTARVLTLSRPVSHFSIDQVMAIYPPAFGVWAIVTFLSTLLHILFIVFNSLVDRTFQTSWRPSERPCGLSGVSERQSVGGYSSGQGGGGLELEILEWQRTIKQSSCSPLCRTQSFNPFLVWNRRTDWGLPLFATWLYFPETLKKQLMFHKSNVTSWEALQLRHKLLFSEAMGTQSALQYSVGPPYSANRKRASKIINSSDGALHSTLRSQQILWYQGPSPVNLKL